MPRKKVTIAPEEIEHLGQLGATVAEVAALFGLAQSSMSERLSRPPLKEPWSRGLATAKLSVRRTLMKKALEDSDLGALIWLSKTLCRDQEPPREMRSEVEVKNDVCVRYIAEWTGSPPAELPPAEDIELLEGEADEE